MKTSIPKAISVLVMGILAFLLLSTVFVVRAATCSGTGCDGLNPNTTGCDATAQNVHSTTSNGARIELRRSSECSTYWARTTNVSGVSKYANATLKYYYFTASPATIANNQLVYSPQKYSSNGAGMAACGQVSDSYLGSMIYSPCVP